MRDRDLARDDVEMVEQERDLLEIDPRHADLLGERPQRVDLAESAALGEPRGERPGLPRACCWRRGARRAPAA